MILEEPSVKDGYMAVMADPQGRAIWNGRPSDRDPVTYYALADRAEEMGFVHTAAMWRRIATRIEGRHP